MKSLIFTMDCFFRWLNVKPRDILFEYTAYVLDAEVTLTSAIN